MKASIIITTYKRSTSLLDAIASCLEQDFEGDIEVLVVDDNGIESPFRATTETLLKDLITAKRIRYIPLDDNQGACVARNRGADEARGEYLFFLDDDDTFLPNKLSVQLSFMDKYSEYDAHLSAFRKIQDGGSVPTPDAVSIVGDLKNFLMYGNFYTPMLCIRRSVFLAVGGFRDIPRYQDMYFMYHLLANHKKVYASSEVLYLLNEHRCERISNQNIGNTIVSVTQLKEFAGEHRYLFTAKEWKIVALRFQFLLATSYYSSSYSNRIRSIRLWCRCLKTSRNAVYISFIIKSLVPNSCIKYVEKIRAKRRL